MTDREKLLDAVVEAAREHLRCCYYDEAPSYCALGLALAALDAAKVEEKPEVVCTCDEPGNPYPCPRCEP